MGRKKELHIGEKRMMACGMEAEIIKLRRNTPRFSHGDIRRPNNGLDIG